MRIIKAHTISCELFSSIGNAILQKLFLMQGYFGNSSAMYPDFKGS